jgi:hypothetical protein
MMSTVHIDRGRLRPDHGTALPRMLQRQCFAVGERQRVVRHPLNVPFLESRISVPQQAFQASIRHRRQQSAQIADDEQELMPAQEPGAERRHDRRRRGHAAMDDIDATDEPHDARHDDRQPRIELNRPVEIRQRREGDVVGPNRRPFAAGLREDRHAQGDLVEIWRQRVHISRERSFDLAQGAIGGAPERHVIDDAQLHARPASASSRS